MKKGTAQVETSLRFGDWLISKGLISLRQLSESLNDQKVNGGRLGEVLRRMNFLTDELMTEALAEYLHIELVRLDDLNKIDVQVARLVPERIAKRFCLVAVGEDTGRVVVAVADPHDVVAIDTVRLKLKREIKLVIASDREIRQAIEVIYHGLDMEERRLRDLVSVEVDQDHEQADTYGGEEFSVADLSSEAAASKAPVIQFVELLLSQAIKSRASDIHIEPQENAMVVRMRIDGVLTDMVPPPRKMQAAVTTRIKILSRMNIAERRLPQDGRFKIKTTGADVDIRVSAIPTIYGEKIVMRILDSSSLNHNLEELGLEPDLLRQFKTVLSQPHGIVVVTGPTGSGKSTTLYSALNYLRDPRKNITTVEDPVEYRLRGINQIQVKPEIDLDFASCLRAILRQDPDIIFIGEIRDKETVEIAIKASLTGHLVLSTFHTNDAPSAISRLAYMGIERYLLASTLNLVMAQRLVRRVCERCKQETELTEDLLRRLRISAEQAAGATFYKGAGCAYCNGVGYLGRAPVFEFMPLDHELREMVVEGASEAQVRKAMREKGYTGLLESGVSRLMGGVTSAEEVLAVTFTEDVSV